MRMTIAPSVSELQRLFHACEFELSCLDMCINTKKSCCIRIGPKYDVKCASISTMKGHNLPWVSKIRYLDNQRPQFRCSVTNAKRSFNQSINAIFGKVGMIASEKVTLQLVKSKCLPIWAHMLKDDLHSLDFVVMRFLMKLFRTANKDIRDECRSFCNFPLLTEMLEITSNKFCKKIKCNKSMLRYFNIGVKRFSFVVIVTLLHTLVKIVRSYHCLFVYCSYFFLLLFLLPFVVNKDVHNSRPIGLHESNALQPSAWGGLFDR